MTSFTKRYGDKMDQGAAKVRFQVAHEKKISVVKVVKCSIEVQCTMYPTMALNSYAVY